MHQRVWWLPLGVLLVISVFNNIFLHARLMDAHSELLEEHEATLASTARRNLCNNTFSKDEVINVRWDDEWGYCICTPAPKCEVYETDAGLFMPYGGRCTFR